jgi:antitoxin CcdA
MEGVMRAQPAKKRAVRIFVDIGLLDTARGVDIDIPEVMEQHLRSLVRAERERRWLRDNREAIASINAFVRHHGLLADRLRRQPQPNERPRS